MIPTPRVGSLRPPARRPAARHRHAVEPRARPSLSTPRRPRSAAGRGATFQIRMRRQPSTDQQPTVSGCTPTGGRALARAGSRLWTNGTSPMQSRGVTRREDKSGRPTARTARLRSGGSSSPAVRVLTASRTMATAPRGGWSGGRKARSSARLVPNGAGFLRRPSIRACGSPAHVVTEVPRGSWSRTSSSVGSPAGFSTFPRSRSRWCLGRVFRYNAFALSYAWSIWAFP